MLANIRFASYNDPEIRSHVATKGLVALTVEVRGYGADGFGLLVTGDVTGADSDALYVTPITNGTPDDEVAITWADINHVVVV